MAINGASLGNYRQYADHASFDNSRISVWAWVKVYTKPTASTKRSIVARWTGLAGGAWKLYAEDVGGAGTDMRFRFGCGISGSGDVVASDASSRNTYEWYRLGGRYDQANVSVFVNGTKTNSSGATTALSALTTAIRLFEETGGANHLDCEIGEVACWGTNLTDAEFAELDSGVSARLVRPANLFLYDACYGGGGKDLLNGLGSDTGTVSPVLDGPPILRRRGSQEWNPVAAGGGGATAARRLVNRATQLGPSLVGGSLVA